MYLVGMPYVHKNEYSMVQVIWVITFPRPSSLSTIVDGLPLPPDTSTGVISQAKEPLSWAAIPRSKLWTAKLSCAKNTDISKNIIEWLCQNLPEQKSIIKYLVFSIYWMVICTEFSAHSHTNILIDIPQTILQHPIN